MTPDIRDALRPIALAESIHFVCDDRVKLVLTFPEDATETASLAWFDRARAAYQTLVEEGEGEISREVVDLVADAMAADTASEYAFGRGDNKEGWDCLARAAVSAFRAHRLRFSAAPDPSGLVEAKEPSNDEWWNRRYGRNHLKPCRNPAVLTCARSECQRQDQCQYHTGDTGIGEQMFALSRYRQATTGEGND